MRSIILILFFCPYLLHSQTVFDTNQFFSKRTYPLLPVGNTHNFIKFPRIEKMQVRTETNDFDFEKQQYVFRIAPTTARKRKAQMALYQHLLAAPNEEVQEAYSQEVFNNHKDWLSLYLISEELEIVARLDSVFRDQQRVYDKLAGSYDFDFQKLVRLQTDKSEVRLNKIELELERQLIVEKQKLETSVLVFDDFVELNAISQRIHSIQTTTNTVVSYEQELLAKEIALEKIKTRQYFDFAEIEYAGPHEDLWKERVSIGLAFNLPNAGSQKLKLQELRIKQVAQQREEAYDSKEKQANVEELAQSLQMALEFYAQTQAIFMEERANLQNISEQVVKKEGFDPLLLLSIEERHLKNELELLKQKEDVLSDYLKYLARSGRLYNRERGNWLEK